MRLACLLTAFAACGCAASVQPTILWSPPVQAVNACVTTTGTRPSIVPVSTAVLDSTVFVVGTVDRVAYASQLTTPPLLRQLLGNVLHSIDGGNSWQCVSEREPEALRWGATLASFDGGLLPAGHALSACRTLCIVGGSYLIADGETQATQVTACSVDGGASWAQGPPLPGRAFLHGASAVQVNASMVLIGGARSPSQPDAAAVLVSGVDSATCWPTGWQPAALESDMPVALRGRSFLTVTYARERQLMLAVGGCNTTAILEADISNLEPCYYDSWSSNFSSWAEWKQIAEVIAPGRPNFSPLAPPVGWVMQELRRNANVTSTMAGLINTLVGVPALVLKTSDLMYTSVDGAQWGVVRDVQLPYGPGYTSPKPLREPIEPNATDSMPSIGMSQIVNVPGIAPVLLYDTQSAPIIVAADQDASVYLGWIGTCMEPTCDVVSGTHFFTGCYASPWDNACKPCSACTGGTYIMKLCSFYDDTVCAPCSSCPPGMRAERGCTLTNDTQCVPINMGNNAVEEWVPRPAQQLVVAAASATAGILLLTLAVHAALALKSARWVAGKDGARSSATSHAAASGAAPSRSPLASSFWAFWRKPAIGGKLASKHIAPCADGTHVVASPLHTINPVAAAAAAATAAVPGHAASESGAPKATTTTLPGATSHELAASGSDHDTAVPVGAASDANPAAAPTGVLPWLLPAAVSTLVWVLTVAFAWALSSVKTSSTATGVAADTLRETEAETRLVGYLLLGLSGLTPAVGMLLGVWMTRSRDVNDAARIRAFRTTGCNWIAAWPWSMCKSTAARVLCALVAALAVCGPHSFAATFVEGMSTLQQQPGAATSRVPIKSTLDGSRRASGPRRRLQIAERAFLLGITFPHLVLLLLGARSIPPSLPALQAAIPVLAILCACVAFLFRAQGILTSRWSTRRGRPSSSWETSSPSVAASKKEAVLGADGAESPAPDTAAEGVARNVLRTADSSRTARVAVAHSSPSASRAAQLQAALVNGVSPAMSTSSDLPASPPLLYTSDSPHGSGGEGTLPTMTSASIAASRDGPGTHSNRSTAGSSFRASLESSPVDIAGADMQAVMAHHQAMVQQHYLQQQLQLQALQALQHSYAAQWVLPPQDAMQMQLQMQQQQQMQSAHHYHGHHPQAAAQTRQVRSRDGTPVSATGQDASAGRAADTAAAAARQHHQHAQQHHAQQQHAAQQMMAGGYYPYALAVAPGQHDQMASLMQLMYGVQMVDVSGQQQAAAASAGMPRMAAAPRPVQPAVTPRRSSPPPGSSAAAAAATGATSPATAAAAAASAAPGAPTRDAAAVQAAAAAAAAAATVPAAPMGYMPYAIPAAAYRALYAQAMARTAAAMPSDRPAATTPDPVPSGTTPVLGQRGASPRTHASAGAVAAQQAAQLAVQQQQQQQQQQYYLPGYGVIPGSYYAYAPAQMGMGVGGGMAAAVAAPGGAALHASPGVRTSPSQHGHLSVQPSTMLTTGGYYAAPAPAAHPAARMTAPPVVPGTAAAAAAAWPAYLAAAIENDDDEEDDEESSLDDDDDGSASRSVGDFTASSTHSGSDSEAVAWPWAHGRELLPASAAATAAATAAPDASLSRHPSSGRGSAHVPMPARTHSSTQAAQRASALPVSPPPPAAAAPAPASLAIELDPVPAPAPEDSREPQ